MTTQATAGIGDGPDGFDYGALPEEHRDAVRAAAFKVRVYGTMTASAAAQIGQQLLEVKARLPHGQYGRWLEAEFGWSESTARRYVAAYRYAVAQSADPSIPRLVTGIDTDGGVDLESFDLSAVYLMVRERVPANLANEALDLVKDGQRVARRHLDAVLARERPPAQPRRPLVEKDEDDEAEDRTARGPGAAWAWPSLAARPSESATAAARRCPAAERTRVRAAADAWSEWLSDLAAELDELQSSRAA